LKAEGYRSRATVKKWTRSTIGMLYMSNIASTEKNNMAGCQEEATMQKGTRRRVYAKLDDEEDDRRPVVRPRAQTAQEF
jgi:hypothetical protein